VKYFRNPAPSPVYYWYCVCVDLVRFRWLTCSACRICFSQCRTLGNLQNHFPSKYSSSLTYCLQFWWLLLQLKDHWS